MFRESLTRLADSLSERTLVAYISAAPPRSMFRGIFRRLGHLIVQNVFLHAKNWHLKHVLITDHTLVSEWCCAMSPKLFWVWGREGGKGDFYIISGGRNMPSHKKDQVCRLWFLMSLIFAFKLSDDIPETLGRLHMHY